MTWYLPEWDEATTFLHAVASGDVGKVRALVAAGWSVETMDETHGEPALLVAARVGKPESIRALLELGADARARTRSGRTLLHPVACSPKLVDLIDLVVRHHGVVDARDDRGATPLMSALAAAFLPGIRELLKRGADPLAREDDGTTTVLRFLLGSSFRKPEDLRPHLALLRELLEAGVDPNDWGWLGQAPLPLTAQRDLPEVIDLLVERGADPVALDRQGLSPAQAGALAGSARALRRLLAHGVEGDVWAAAALGDVALLGRLLDARPESVNAKPAADRTSVLATAIEQGHAEAVRLLLERGADPKGPCRSGSCLHAAVDDLPDPDVVRLLIEHGADVDAGDGDSNTPLNFAARRGNIAVARVLLEHGADVNAPTERGYPPLYFAKDDEMREFLIARGGRLPWA